MKKQKRFTTVEMILDFIHKNKKAIKNSHAQLERREIEFGDEWDSESGYEYTITFPDKTAYIVGTLNIIEDREDYAQADSWTKTYCLDYYKERAVETTEVIEKIEGLIK